MATQVTAAGPSESNTVLPAVAVRDFADVRDILRRALFDACAGT